MMFKLLEIDDKPRRFDHNQPTMVWKLRVCQYTVTVCWQLLLSTSTEGRQYAGTCEATWEEFAVCGEMSYFSFLFTMHLQRQIEDLLHSIELLSKKQRTEEPLRALEKMKENPSLQHSVA